MKLNEKIAQFSKEFENGLTQSLNWYNQVTLYLDNILKLFAKNRMGSEDELKKLADYYITDFSKAFTLIAF